MMRSGMNLILAKMNDKEPEWQERFATVVARAQEMIYKEANILFPNCAANFTEEEWIGIYQDRRIMRLFRRGAGDLAEGRG